MSLSNTGEGMVILTHCLVRAGKTSGWLLFSPAVVAGGDDVNTALHTSPSRAQSGWHVRVGKQQSHYLKLCRAAYLPPENMRWRTLKLKSAIELVARVSVQTSCC